MRISILIACILLSGCKVTEQKAKDWAYNHKSELAKWCADCFPVKPIEVIKGVPVLIPGDTVVTTDTVKVQVDCPDGTKVECPPARIITIRDTLVSVDTIKVRDTAKERVLEDSLSDREDRLTDALKSRNTWRKWCLIFGGLFGIGVVLRFIKK